jgi:hypothetical protein
VHILDRWLRRFAGHPAIFPLDGRPDWQELVRHGRALSLDELVFQELGDERDDAGEDLAEEGSRRPAPADDARRAPASGNSIRN